MSQGERINPRMLSWGRETAGLSIEQAAEKLGSQDTAKAGAADKLHALEAGGRVARAEKGINTRPLQGYHQNTHRR